MTKENVHRLLKRQLKEHIGNVDELPENIKQFINAVNMAYRDYDHDLQHTEHILKESSQELFKKNKELNELNAQQEKIISEKTKDLINITNNLQNAEKIAGLGNFSWNINSGEVLLSAHFCEMVGLSEYQTQLSTSELGNLFHDTEKIANAIEEAVIHNKKIVIEQLKLKNEGSRIFVLEGDILQDENELKIFTGVIQDVTEQNKREQDLNETLQELENYKKAIDHAGIISKSNRQGKITYVNNLFQEISGYSEEELLGSDHNIVNSGLHEKKYFANMWRTISSGNVWKGVFRNKKKDGTYYWVDSTIVPFTKNNQVEEYISIRFDITEKMLIHQKVEEQKGFYETILNNIPVDIAVFNDKHQYLFINPIAIKDTETRKFIIGKDDFEYCEQYGKDKQIAVYRRELFDKVKTTQLPTEFLDKHVKKDGNITYNLRKFFPVLNDKNEFLYMIGFGIDITENIEQSLKIEESLKEKEALLGEVHHRVKNNLALVLGLIEMQLAKSQSDVLRQELSEVQHRILSSTKKAIPVALIVNELITNSYKYAFKEKTSGNIYISLKKHDSFVILTVADDGPGLTEGIDLTKLNSLGFKLLNIFTKQLKGTYVVKNENGLSISITFKDEQEGFNS